MAVFYLYPVYSKLYKIADILIKYPTGTLDENITRLTSIDVSLPPLC